MNYEQDIRIDESALDIEWLEQPSLMMKYTRHAATTKADVDRAKERLDLVKAELDKEIRLDPTAFGIEKMTETVILNTIIAQNRYKKENEDYIEIRFEHQIAQGAVSSIEQRKTALENLVKLHGQQYFAGPSVPRDLSKEWEQKEKQKRSNAAVSTKLKRKNR